MDTNMAIGRKRLTIGCRLAHLRKVRGLTQVQASEQLGISRSTLNFYEIDKRKPDFEQFVFLAQFYGVTLSYLAGINEEQLAGLSDSAVLALKEQYGRYPETAHALISKMLESPLFQRIIRDMLSVMESSTDISDTDEIMDRKVDNKHSVVLKGKEIPDFYTQRAMINLTELIKEIRKEYHHGKESNP